MIHEIRQLFSSRKVISSKELSESLVKIANRNLGLVNRQTSYLEIELMALCKMYAYIISEDAIEDLIIDVSNLNHSSVIMYYCKLQEITEDRIFSLIKELESSSNTIKQPEATSTVITQSFKFELINRTVKYIKYFDHHDITLDGEVRKITLCVLCDKDTGKIKVGYSLLRPNDKFDKELGCKIAEGRALSEKNPTIPDMFLCQVMRTKYYLRCIELDILFKLEEGKLIIPSFSIIRNKKVETLEKLLE